MSKFKINDEVLTKYGRGVIVYLDVDDDDVSFLVKIEGFDGHGGTGLGYTNPDGMGDKWWFCEDELTLIEKEENKYEVGDLVRVKEGVKTRNKHGRVFFIRKSEHPILLTDEEIKSWYYDFELEPVTHLTTKEFIKLVEDMGYEIYNGIEEISIENGSPYGLASVHKTKVNTLGITRTLDMPNDLFKVSAIYANTPLELREEKEQLYTLELPNNNKKHKYYQHMYEDNKHYTFGKLRKGDTWKCYFTQKEIDELPNQELIKALKQEPVK